MNRFSATASLALGVLLAGLLAAAPARAHKVIASVYASGAKIEGEIGFSNGDMAGDALVEVFDDAGEKLGETRTDGEGFFVFAPTRPVAHVFRADLGAGHVAEARMAVEDLPPALRQAAPAGGGAAAAAIAVTDALPAAPPSEAERELIAEMLRQELRPLRREIAAYKEKNDLQTVLGGIGYIIGLFGLGFYLSAQRRLRKA